MVDAATENGMEIQSCAEFIDLEEFGVMPGKCIDGDQILKLWNHAATKQKDPLQREACGCVRSRDIGAYCYATEWYSKCALKHDPLSPSIAGWFDVPLVTDKKINAPNHPNQMSLDLAFEKESPNGNKVA
jgi:hypothetical protein